MDLAAEVRAADRNAYLAILFAPEAVRPALFALAAYTIELDRIVRRVHEPLAAEVRLQWWRDAIRNEGFGEGANIPLVLALREAMARYGWPADTLGAMSEARIHDLYSDPFETLDAFDGYAGEAFSAPLQLAAMALAVDAAGREDGMVAARTAADAAGHGGVALAVADAVLAERARLAAGRTHIPQSVWSQAGAGNVAERIAEGREPQELAGALAALSRHGLAADEAMRAGLADVDPRARGALLPALGARPVLRQAAARPLDTRRPGPVLAQWRIWRNARILQRL